MLVLKDHFAKLVTQHWHRSACHPRPRLLVTLIHRCFWISGIHSVVHKTYHFMFSLYEISNPQTLVVRAYINMSSFICSFIRYCSVVVHHWLIARCDFWSFSAQPFIALNLAQISSTPTASFAVTHSPLSFLICAQHSFNSSLYTYLIYIYMLRAK